MQKINTIITRLLLIGLIFTLFLSVAEAAVFIDYGAVQQSVVQFNASVTTTIGSNSSTGALAGWILPDTQLKFINGTVLFNVFTPYTNLTNASMGFNRSASFFYFNSTKATNGSVLGTDNRFIPGNYTLQRFFNISVDTTTLTDGNWSVNFSITGVDSQYYNLTYYNNTNTYADLGSNKPVNNTAFIVDNTAPTVSYATQNLADETVRDTGTLGFVNISVTTAEIYPSVAKFILSNSTTTRVFSQLITPDFANLSYNFTGLSDGNYTYNVTVNDTTAHFGISTSRSLVLDTVSPTATMTSGSGTTTTLSVEETMTCAQTDTNPANVTMTRSDKSGNQCTGTSSCTAKFLSTSYTSPTFTCATIDKAGHTKSVTFSFDRIDPPVSGAATPSGGGGGSSSSAGLGTVAAETTTTAPINTPEVREVTFTLAQAASSAKVSVQTTTTQPAGTPAISGKAFAYFDVTTTGFTSTDVKKSQIKFAVPSTWLKDNGFTTADIVLHVYRGGVWKALKTSAAGGDETSEFFTADTEGFSTFAIIAQKAVVAPPTTTETPEVIPSTEQQAAETAAASKGKWGWIAALVILAVIVVAFVVMKKQKKKR